MIQQKIYIINNLRPPPQNTTKPCSHVVLQSAKARPEVIAEGHGDGLSAAGVDYVRHVGEQAGDGVERPSRGSQRRDPRPGTGLHRVVEVLDAEDEVSRHL